MRRIARALGPPLGAFLAARVFLCVVSATTSRPPWQPGSWSGPDTAHYLSIAKYGYALVPCSADDPPPGHCGNAGWMPAYAWTLRPLMAAGMSPRWASVVASACFALLSLAALWVAFLSSWREGALEALLVAAFFFGQVYHHGAFPLSLFALFAILCLAAALRDRFLLAGLAGAGATLTYSTGWLLAPVLLAWGLASATPASRRGAALGALLTLGGLPVVLALQWWEVGAWNAFFLVQGAYGHGLHNPLLTWWHAVRVVFAPPWQGVQEGPHLQTLLAGAWAAGAIAWAGRSGDRASRLFALYVLAFWLFPLVMGPGVSLYRAEATLLPGVPAMRGLPRPVLALALLATIVVAWPMGVLFFRLLLV